jgi:hypothetical protein
MKFDPSIDTVYRQHPPAWIATLEAQEDNIAQIHQRDVRQSTISHR